MILRSLALLGLLTSAAVGWWWSSRAQCERECQTVDAEVTALFERGDLVAVLERIDDVDARCRCARFVEGDAPPLYGLAVVCVQRLRREGRAAEADGILARSRGPILRDLSTRGH
jgi:hypothetical protein